MAKSQISNGNHNHSGAYPRRRYDYYNHFAIYRWIVAYKIMHDGNSPSYGDIMRKFGISSRSVVNGILSTMVRAGYITRERGSKRGICIVGAQWTPPVKV